MGSVQAVCYWSIALQFDGNELFARGLCREAGVVAQVFKNVESAWGRQWYLISPGWQGP